MKINYFDLIESTRLVYIYDEYEDEFEDTYIKDKNSYKEKNYPKDNTFLIKASVYSSKVNTVLGLLVLSGVLLLPMAIAAELDINAISQQISVLQGILTDYYVDLLLNTEDIIGRLITIATSLTSISTAVAANAATLATNAATLTANTATLNTNAATLQTNAATLQTIITLINNLSG